MIARIVMFIAFFGLSVSYVPANNVRITDKVKVAGQLGKDTLLLSFPLAWDNSWRLGENWDAVYLFFKYKRVGVEEPWHQLYIKEDGNNPGSGMTYIPVTNDGTTVGMMVYRSGSGSGNINTMVRVKTDITQGDMLPYYRPTIADFKNGAIEIAVGAIEMVFVPNGPYYLGDGASAVSFMDERGDPIYMSAENEWLTLYELNKGTAKKLPPLYPKGYGGFYCMKYEISQEQYTYFLNKVSYTEQKKRIGNNLDAMSVGDYAFGTGAKAPFRNGIILEKKRGSGNAAVFGHNLDRDDGVFNGETDGQNVACNFLTPQDMYAYADWVGLRPMSELEYEKACRPRNPVIKPVIYESAWNGRYDENKLAASVKYEGTRAETVNDGANLNAWSKILGPVRCGAFARAGNTSQVDAGASYWGGMELTGNLWEMCVNVDSDSSMIREKHGDGNIYSDVIWRIDSTVHFSEKRRRHNDRDSVQVYNFSCSITWPYKDKLDKQLRIDINKKLVKIIHEIRDSFVVSWDTVIMVPRPAWPHNAECYGMRGGSFCSNDYRFLSVSDRQKMNSFHAGDKRSEEVSFRLVHSVEVKNIRTGVIAMNNNRNRDTSVFSADAPYTIKEIEESFDAPESILYRWEVDSNGTWTVVEGAISRELVLASIWNNARDYKEYKFRRKSQTVFGEGYSNTVTLVVPGFYPRLEPEQGIVDACNQSTPIVAYFPVPVTKVRWLREDGSLLLETLGGTSSSYAPKRTDFTGSGTLFRVKCEVTLNGVVQTIWGTVKLITASADDCPAVFTDARDGETYHAQLMPDCRCWMVEDLRYKTADSETAADGSGTQMYNWMDLMNEYGEDYPTKPSQICPEGWKIPTIGMAANLANFGVSKVDFKAMDRGALDLWGDPLIHGNYWVAVYSYTEHNNFVDIIGGFGPTYLTIVSNMLAFRKGVLDDESEGYIYFPVRCVKLNVPKN